MVKPYYYIYWPGAGFLSGILLASLTNFAWLWFYGFIWLLIILLLFIKRPYKFLVASFFIALIFGWWRWQMSWPVIDDSQPAFYYNQAVTVEGYVSGEVEQRKNHQQLTLKVKKINQQVSRGQILVYLPLFPEYNYGDVLRFIGTVKQPEKFDDFAYDKYLARYDIYALLYYPQVVKLEEPRAGFDFYYHILRLKKSLISRVNRLLPEPEAALLGGLLWGAKRSLPQEVLDNFNATGTTHIVALSGYNITVLGLIIFFLCPWVGIKRQSAFWLVLAVILFFIVVTGYPASVVRAGIMGILVLLSLRWGGGIKAGVLLMLSAGIMCIFNPKALIYDVGFQLSFLATIGLVYLSPRWERFFHWLPKKMGLSETVTATSAAIVMTAPLIAYQFTRLSLIGLISNVLILFIIPVTMALGFVGVLISFIFSSLGQVIIWLAYLPLTYIINLTDWLAKLPGASITVTGWPLELILLTYFLLFFYIFYAQFKKLLFKKN